MQFKSYLQSKLPLFFVLSLTLVLASCGSYQYVGSDNDGIYNSSIGVPVENNRNVETPSSNNDYYKELFAEGSKQFENISQSNNVVFTDIDSYVGTYTDEDVNAEVVYEDGYAGWGQDNQTVIININNNPWGGNNFGFGGFGLGFYRPWWGFRNHFGFNNFGYGGFYDPFWPYHGFGGFGFGGLGYGGFGYGGFGFGGLGYGGFHGNFSNSNQISYNSGRRGAVNSFNASSNVNVSRRSNNTSLNSSRNTTFRRNDAGSRNSNLNTNVSRRNNNASLNSNTSRNNTRVNSNINNSTRVNSNTNNSTRVNSPVTNRANSNNISRENSSSRSSGSSMSSGSSRSSSSGGGGGRSSGGGGGGGRRGG